MFHNYYTVCMFPVTYSQMHKPHNVFTNTAGLVTTPALKFKRTSAQIGCIVFWFQEYKW